MLIKSLLLKILLFIYVYVQTFGKKEFFFQIKNFILFGNSKTYFIYFLCLVLNFLQEKLK